MSNTANRNTHNSYLLMGGLLILGAIILSILLLLWSILGNRSRPLKPIRTPSATVAVDGQPISITFPQLSENLVGFRGQRIRVTGNYRSLPAPTCRRFSGPIIRWALVAEGLQLNAIGFESLLRLVPANTSMTIEGIWREYRGPSGCFGAADNGRLWYLEVERILQPNPLPGRGNLFVDNSGLGGIEGSGGNEPISPPGMTETPGTPVSPTDQPLGTPGTELPTTATPTPLFPTPFASATPTAVGSDTTPAPSPTPLAIPTIGASVTPTATPTSPSTAGTPTLTPTVTATPVPGPTLPGLPTAPPGTGYPPPPPTETPDDPYS